MPICDFLLFGIFNMLDAVYRGTSILKFQVPDYFYLAVIAILPMIPIHLNEVLDKLKGPTREQLIVGNQWAVSALERYHHEGLAKFEFVVDGIRHTSKISWDSSFSRAAMQERIDMAHHGGVALAMFLMAVHLDYGYVEQTEIGQGTDYKFMKMPPSDDDLNFMQGGHYVEVSGLLEETGSNTLRSRITDKHAQIRRGRGIKREASVVVTLF